MSTTVTRRRFAQLAALLAASAAGFRSAAADEPSPRPRPAPAPPTTWSDAEAAIPVTSDDPMWGERLAPVTLVVFGNYQCPFTRKLSATVEELERIIGPKKLRVIWKHNPLDVHKRARPAAIAAEVVRAKGGSRAFFAWSRLAFDNQKDLTDQNFALWAQRSGVPIKTFSESLGKPAAASKVDKDLAEGKSASVTGTPASFVNGVAVMGSQPVERFVAIIDDELSKVQGLKIKPDRVYIQRCNANVALAATTPKPPRPPPPPMRPQAPRKLID